MKKIYYIVIVLTVFLFACKRPEKYSDIPEIKFISFEKLNQTDGILVFSFQDGDGDIGLNESDIYPPFDISSIYYYNFFCDCYEKRHGIFEKYVFKDSTVTLNARIPRLSNLSEESINGEIYLKMIPYRDRSPYDTVKLTFYIVDRKLNHSNVEEVVVINN